MQRTETGVERTEVVIVGSGFGGLAAAKRLGRVGIRCVLISRTPEHLFQPLLYQVATGILEPREIAAPIADVLRHYPSIDVRLGDVVGVDPDESVITYTDTTGAHQLAYRSLIVAVGAEQSYFGRDEFAERTFALKTLDDALRLRAQLARVFAAADTTDDEQVRRRLRSFVVVGAGPTGVELAGQLEELARRHFDRPIEVTLIEAAGLVLPPFGGRLSSYAKLRLAHRGVDVQLNTTVTDIDDRGVTVRDQKGREHLIEAETVVWSAGVQAGALARTLADATGCATDRAGRLLVNQDLTVGGYANIYLIGDAAALHGYPGQSPVAMQAGRHVADVIRRVLDPGTRFVYHDKGSMAMVERFAAVADLGRPFRLTGMIAWLLWLGVHLFYLVGFRNRVVAVASWAVAFIGDGRPGLEHLIAAAHRGETPVAGVKAAAPT
ncbi:NAD(P)/FAD-dependent oxidoreductase [Skermania piniformis]|uniref:NAD(P)/FAD-dependent oxidoreductase n=1 Tax=Skermania pinensis TaxID=39122 RepID=UPI000B20819B|nr:NAD(P)/FAD-dependent oxidoreductase [Skermania piniformis]